MSKEQGQYRILTAQVGTLSHGTELPDGAREFLRGAPHSIATYLEGFAAVVPDAPYVPFDSGSHFMLVPFSEKNHDIGDLLPEELDVLSAVMLTHIGHNNGKKDPSKIVSINIGKENEPNRRDPNSKIGKLGPRTMRFLHLHFLESPQDMVAGLTKREVRRRVAQSAPEDKIEFFRHKLIEPHAGLIETVLRRQIATFGRFEVVGIGQERGSGYYPHLDGALDFTIPKNCTPREMTEFLQSLDTQYRTLHRTIFGSAITNYDELVSNDFKGDLQFADNPQVPNLGLEQKDREKLNQLVKRASSQNLADIDPLRQVFIPPSYSLGIADGVVTFVPHINTGRGGTEALGITSLRIPGDDEGDRKRHIRSFSAAQDTIAEAIQEHPGLFSRKMERLLPQLGLADAPMTAEAIARIATLTDVEGVKQVVMHEPTKDYMYQDVARLMERVSQSNDTATLWTEGETEYQTAKVYSSGIDTDTVKPYISEEKISILPEIIQEQLKAGMKEIVIFDDKYKKLKGAFEYLTGMQSRGELNPDISIRLVWVAQDPKTYVKPTKEEDVLFVEKNITRVRGLKEVIDLLYPDGETDLDPRLLLFDVDRTLLNSQYYLMNLGRAIDEYLQQK